MIIQYDTNNKEEWNYDNIQDLFQDDNHEWIYGSPCDIFGGTSRVVEKLIEHNSVDLALLRAKSSIGEIRNEQLEDER